MIQKIIFRPGGLATFLFRASAYFHKKGRLGWMLSMIFWRLNILLNSCEIEPIAKIGQGFHIFHPVGLVIGNATIGKNANLFQNVTIGQNPLLNKLMPVIGDNVTIFAGAVVVGHLNIGSNSIIGANTVITRSIPENSVVRAPFPEVRVKDMH
jgi:serine O-acetyltransferase